MSLFSDILQKGLGRALDYVAQSDRDLMIGTDLINYRPFITVLTANDAARTFR